MTLDQVQQANPHLKIYSSRDDRFRPYGRVLTGYVLDEIEACVQASLQLPGSGSTYIPFIPEISNTRAVQQLFYDVYGGLEAQAGICAGQNKVFNGIEFHQGSETVIALTDCVLFVGKKADMTGQNYDGGLAECFFLEKGQIIEMYDTTLHYCPCNTGGYFITVVILLKGTNTPIEKPAGLLTKKNKWFITHKSVEAKVKAGCVAGLLGEINYIN